MKLERMLKRLIVTICVVALMLPSFSNVALAAFETAKDSKTTFGISILHPSKDVDGNKFGYKIGNRVTYRTFINDNGSADFSTYIFCLDMNGKFPSEDGTKNTNYTSQGEFTKENASKLDSAKAEKIINLITKSNMYDDFEEKIAQVYAERIEEDKDLIPPTTVETIKNIITDDDLFFAMQLVIWEITNDLDLSKNAITYTIDGDVFNGQGTYPQKAELIATAVEYYRNLSNTSSSDESNTNPTIKDTEKTTIEDGDYLYVGPFHITSGTNTNFTVTFKDQDDEMLEGYSLVDAPSADGKRVTNIKRALDQDLYVKLPANTDITKVKMELDVKGDNETSITLWTSDVANAQPLISIESKPNDIHEETEVTITKPEKVYDLALRKYITAVNGTEITSRIPNIIYDDQENRIEYNHKKDPVLIKPGDKVVYTLTVYNEGSEKGTATKIRDYLPEGLSYVEDSEINREYGWIVSADGRYATTAYTENYELDPFDRETMNLSSTSVKIECVVNTEFTEGILTNLAEIVEDNVDDVDSVPGSINIDEIDLEPYKGKETNKDDLSDSNYYYEGREDDDDFEKLKVEPEPEPEKEIDLALRKYISTVNGENKERRPVVDVTDLVNDTSTTAEYNHSKEPVTVKTGDIVVYSIRVYNEGEEDAYVNEITDYIPEGLGFLVNHTINYNNGWRIDSENAETVKLSTIKDGTNNVTASDFVTGGDVSEEDVVLGRTTIRTDLLKYTEGGNTNLIPAFDKSSNEPSSLTVQVACIVTAEEELDNDTLKNIAAITEEADKDGNVIEADRDSEPDEIDVDSYPEDSNIQDDDDYEDLTLVVKRYDLALKKFINAVNGTQVDPSREPIVDTTKLANDETVHDADYTMSKDPVQVKVGDTIVYTIRVYNEGEVDAIAKEIVDNVPEGLEFVTYEVDENGNYVSGSQINYQYKWETFTEETETGWTEGVRTRYLETQEPIKAFDKDNNVISYADVQIEFRVISKTPVVITNIAEITEDDGDDEDSEPDNKDEEEDDQDEENVIPVVFDLALQKFITGLNDKEITDREPSVIINENGEIDYTHTQTPLDVANENIVTYTIRVYNEGSVEGYASVIKDDIPEGLVFLPENETNVSYMWKMYRELKDGEDPTSMQLATFGGKQYVQVTDPNEAELIATDYYSKANSDARGEGPIKAYDKQVGITDTNPDYRDVKVAFKVNQEAIDQENRVIINTAEITDDQDENGNPIDDVDSEPNNDKDGEDDIDNERITVKYFDLSLLKYVSQVRVTEDGKTKVTDTGYDGTENPDPVVKVEIHRKKLKTTQVVFVFQIKVTNEGELEGYATELTDYIPEGLLFYEEDNEEYGWKQREDGAVTTDYLKDTLLKPGESATVEIALRWDRSEKNLGLKTNVAEISDDYNEYNTPDIDSTPNNKKDGEDDIDDASVILSISTGGTQLYIILTITIISVLGCGIFAIKKYVLV